MCPSAGDNSPKGLLIPHTSARPSGHVGKGGLFMKATTEGAARGPSASWRGNGSPRQRRVAGLRGRPATLELRDGPDTYGWQQSRIFLNGGNPEGATPRGG